MSAIRSFQEKSAISGSRHKSTDAANTEYEEDDDIYGSDQSTSDYCSRVKPLGCPYGKFKAKKKYALMYGQILEKSKGNNNNYLCPVAWEYP